MIRLWHRLGTGGRRDTWLLLVGLLVLFCLTANRRIEDTFNDIFYVAEPAYALAVHGTLNLDTLPAFPSFPWLIQVAGHFRSDRFPGAILLAVPFYAVFRIGEFDLWPSALAGATLTAIAIALMHRTLLTLVNRRIALGSAVVLALGTAMWSVAADGIWTEGPTMLGLALAMWGLSTGRRWAIGVGFVTAVMSRPHAGIFAVVSAIWNGVQRRWKTAIVCAIGVALGLFGVLLWNKINGNQWTLLIGSYTGRASAAVNTGANGEATSTRWGADYLYTFFSPLRGIFVYSPFLLLLLPGVVRAWRSAPTWVRSFAVGGVLYLVIQLAGNSWFGAPVFGYRLILPSLFGWTPLLTVSYQKWTARQFWSQALFAVLAAASMWWFAIGASVSARDFYVAVNDPRLYSSPGSWSVPILASVAGPWRWLAAVLLVVGVAMWLRATPEGSDPEGQRVEA